MVINFQDSDMYFIICYTIASQVIAIAAMTAHDCGLARTNQLIDENKWSTFKYRLHYWLLHLKDHDVVNFCQESA